MTIRFQLFICALFLVAEALAQSAPPQAPQTLTPEQMQKVEQLSKLQRDFGKKMNSPGVDLTLKETNRSRTGDRTLVTYSLYGSGLSTQATYTLIQVQMDGRMMQVMQGVTLNAKGEAICAGRPGTCQGDGPNDPVDLVVYAGKGEPKRFGLVSEDKDHTRGFVSVIPFPNAAGDKGCRLESVLGMPNGEITYIQGTGFEPNADLNVDSQSYDEKHHITAKAEADGSYFATWMPYVSGKKSGETVVEVKSEACSPKLKFSWGSYHLQ
jgi:hypothetical protein